MVEDDPAVSAVIRDILERVGLGALCRRDDREVLAAIPTKPQIFVALVDINSDAETTGFDVARAARTPIPKLANIYVTGQASPASVKAFGVGGRTSQEAVHGRRHGWTGWVGC